MCSNAGLGGQRLCLPHLWFLWKAPLRCAEGKGQGHHARNLQSILWWTPKLLFLRKDHYVLNKHLGGSWLAEPLLCNGWASHLSELTQAQRNSYEFVWRQMACLRNLGKAVERGEAFSWAIRNTRESDLGRDWSECREWRTLSLVVTLQIV